MWMRQESKDVGARGVSGQRTRAPALGGGPGGGQGVAVCPDPRGWVATGLGQEGLLGSVRLTLPQDREGWA